MKYLTPVGGEVPIVGRLCDARLLVDEWRLERGDEEEKPKAKQRTRTILRYVHGNIIFTSIHKPFCHQSHAYFAPESNRK